MQLHSLSLHLLLFFWTAQVITCQFDIPQDCKPEMEEICQNFCDTEPLGAKYCTVEADKSSCAFKERGGSTPCEDSTRAACLPLREFLRCQDSKVECDCGRTSRKASCSVSVSPLLILTKKCKI